MFYFNPETEIQKEYKALRNRASSRDSSPEELGEIITALVRLDNKILSSPTPINPRLHFEIKDLALTIVYDRRQNSGGLPEECRLSDSRLLEAYTQLRAHPGFAQFNEKTATYKRINRYIKNLEEAVANNPVVSPESRIQNGC